MSSSRPSRRRRALGPLVALVVLALVAAGCDPAPRIAAKGWHLSWRAENVFVAATASTTTCRFVARLSGTGSRVRFEFTSSPGTAGFMIKAGWVGLATDLRRLDVVPTTNRPLLFAGWPETRVAPGSSVLSDPLPMPVVPNTGVTVTLTATAGDASSKAGRMEPGACTPGAPSRAGALPGSAFGTPASTRWLRSVLVDGPTQRSVVALGDSITEGPSGYYVRWTDQLAAAGLTVANAGVGGNAISRPGLFGTVPATERAIALLREPNVTDLVVLMGTNDIAFGASATQVLTALGSVLASARATGVTAYVGTVLPRGVADWPAERETQRRLLNAQLRGGWLAARGAKLIDTEAALRDPARPLQLLRAYDSGDGLHPNAAGSARLGRAVLEGLVPSRVAPAPPATPVPTVEPTTPSTPAPMPSAPAPTPTPSAPAPTPTPSTPTSAPTVPADPGTPTPTEPAPTPTEPAPTPTEPVPTPTEPVPTPAGSAPTPSSPGTDGGTTDASTALDVAAIEMAPQTAGYLKVRALAPAFASWSW